MDTTDQSRVLFFFVKNSTQWPGQISSPDFSSSAQVMTHCPFYFGDNLIILLFFLFLIFFRKAVVLDHSRTPCTNPNDFIPLTKNKIYVFYIRMDSINDFTTWSNVANCLKIWDLDPRGFHKRLWRLWLKDNHVLIVGCPVSPYCNYKPSRLQPIHITKKKKSWK